MITKTYLPSNRCDSSDSIGNSDSCESCDSSDSTDSSDSCDSSDISDNTDQKTFFSHILTFFIFFFTKKKFHQRTQTQIVMKIKN